jgi:hypothetical protein
MVEAGLTPEQWVFWAMNGHKRPINRKTVDSKKMRLALAKLPNEIAYTDLAWVCLYVLSQPKKRLKPIGEIVEDLEKDLKTLLKIRTRHQRLLPQLYQIMGLTNLPQDKPMDYLGEYVFRVEGLMQLARAMPSHQRWNPHRAALHLLENALKKSGRIPRGALRTLNQAFEELDFQVNFENERVYKSRDKLARARSLKYIELPPSDLQ